MERRRRERVLPVFPPKSETTTRDGTGQGWETHATRAERRHDPPPPPPGGATSEQALAPGRDGGGRCCVDRLSLVLRRCSSSPWPNPIREVRGPFRSSRSCHVDQEVCTFYQKGSCSYGSRCRYDHVKVSRNPTVAPPPSSSTTTRASSSLQPLSFGRPHHVGYQADSSNPRQQISMDVLAHSGSKPVWRNDFQHESVLEDGIDWSISPTVQNQTTLSPADLPICSFAAGGNCPYGEECPQMHGDLCTTCGKMCLHPYRPDEREEHTKLCEKNHKRLESLKRSQEIECSVCLDRVLSKPTAAERKFGLLSECDHPFCISCIRNWRNNSPTSGMDVNSALRACPICRKLSYYVIPSVLWYFSKEEKLEIIDNYKAKLKSIDCKYFDFGTGTCPFGSSCFYKHAYKDGRLEEVILRHLDADDGSTVIAKNIRLSDFLSRLHL